MQVIWALGHENISAMHPTTLMITKDKHLSRLGDCVVAVGAEKAALDLDAKLKNMIKMPNAKVTIAIDAGDLIERIFATGSSDLRLNHPMDLVIRKSDFISDRTIAIGANKASKDLDRNLIQQLQNPNQKIKITIIVEA